MVVYILFGFGMDLIGVVKNLCLLVLFNCMGLFDDFGCLVEMVDYLINLLFDIFDIYDIYDCVLFVWFKFMVLFINVGCGVVVVDVDLVVVLENN